MPSSILFYLGLVVYMAGVLLTIGIVAVVWTRLAALGSTSLVHGLRRLGLARAIDRVVDGRRTDDDPDRSFIAFTRVLRGASSVIPGDPQRHPHTIILPVLLIGLPLAIALILALWVTPLLLFGYVVGTVPGPWATLLAILSVFVYVGVLVGVWRNRSRPMSYLRSPFLAD